MSEIRRLGRHSTVYGLAQALNAGLGLILLPLYTRFLVPADYGIWQICAVSIAFSTVILQAGMQPAVTQAVLHESPEAERRLYATSFVLTAILSAGFAGLVASTSGNLSVVLFGDAAQSRRLGLLGLGIALNVLPTIPLQRIRLQERSLLFASLGVARFVCGGGLSVFLIAGLGWGVDGLVAAFVGQAALTSLLVVPPFLREIGLAWDRPRLRRMLAFGIPVIPVGISMQTMELSDRFFLKAYRGLGEVGIYGIGCKIALALMLAVQAVKIAWPPVMYTLVKREDGHTTLARLVTYAVVLLAWGGLALSLLAREALAILATQAYYSGHRVVALVSLAYLFLGVRILIAVGASVHRKTGRIAIAATTSCAVNLLLNFLLIPPWGATGAAVATAASYGCLALLVGRIAQRYYPVPFEWRRLATVAVVAVGLFAAGLAAPAGSILIAVILKAGLIAAFPVLLLLAGFLSETERRDLREILRRIRSR